MYYKLLHIAENTSGDIVSHAHSQPVPLGYNMQQTPLEDLRVCKGLRSGKW